MKNTSKIPGIAQWFSFNDKASVEKAVIMLNELGVTELRTLFSWADWERPGGEEWFDYFVGRLGDGTKARLLPSPFYTPEAMAMRDAKGKGLTSYPPKDPKKYVGFIKKIIDRYGKYFDWVQVWNEPNWKAYWDERLDPYWKIYAGMAEETIKEIHKAGKKAVIGGLTPLEPQWFMRMNEYGVLKLFDALAFHQSTGSWPDRRRWFGWETEINTLKAMLKGIEFETELWLTETGFSTIIRNKDEKREVRDRAQIEYFEELKHLPFDRIYWFCLFDQPEETPTDDAINLGLEPDPTAYHFGLIRADGTPKPLYDHWKKAAKK